MEDMGGISHAEVGIYQPNQRVERATAHNTEHRSEEIHQDHSSQAYINVYKLQYMASTHNSWLTNVEIRTKSVALGLLMKGSIICNIALRLSSHHLVHYFIEILHSALQPL